MQFVLSVKSSGVFGIISFYLGFCINKISFDLSIYDVKDATVMASIGAPEVS